MRRFSGAFEELLGGAKDPKNEIFPVAEYVSHFKFSVFSTESAASSKTPSANSYSYRTVIAILRIDRKACGEIIQVYHPALRYIFMEKNDTGLDLSLPQTSVSSALSEEGQRLAFTRQTAKGSETEDLNVFAKLASETGGHSEEASLRPFIAYGVVDHHTAPAVLGGFEDSAEIQNESYHRAISSVKPNQLVEDEAPHPLYFEAGFHLKF